MREIAKINVTQAHKAPQDATSLSTKLQFELDLHGLVRCTSVVQNHKIEVEEPAAAPPAASAAKEEAPKAADAPPGGDSEMADATAAGGEGATDGNGLDGGDAKAAAAAATGDAEGAENGDASNMDTEAAPPAESEPTKTVKKTKKVRFSPIARCTCLVVVLRSGITLPHCCCLHACQEPCILRSRHTCGRCVCDSPLTVGASAGVERCQVRAGIARLDVARALQRPPRRRGANGFLRCAADCHR